MDKGQILDNTKVFQLKCGVCQGLLFAVVVAHDGATCVCCACLRKYKLESIGGVKIANA